MYMYLSGAAAMVMTPIKRAPAGCRRCTVHSELTAARAVRRRLLHI
eukprot:SAG22_NODE_21446_length_257_cov_0.645570_1_plen_45_part_10